MKTFISFKVSLMSNKHIVGKNVYDYVTRLKGTWTKT